MTREQQVNKLLAPMYAAITKDIAVTLDYAPYVMDGLIGPKLSEFEKGVIEEHITSYVTQNQKKMMGSDFDEISNEMCDQLISGKNPESSDLIGFPNRKVIEKTMRKLIAESITDQLIQVRKFVIGELPNRAQDYFSQFDTFSVMDATVKPNFS
jgi:hypothetical protein